MRDGQRQATSAASHRAPPSSVGQGKKRNRSTGAKPSRMSSSLPGREGWEQSPRLKQEQVGKPWGMSKLLVWRDRVVQDGWG